MKHRSSHVEALTSMKETLHVRKCAVKIGQRRNLCAVYERLVMTKMDIARMTVQ